MKYVNLWERQQKILTCHDNLIRYQGMAFLMFYHNDQAVMRHALKDTITTIGRDSTNDIQLMDDYISRVHCTIERTDGLYVITDKSTNGIFLGDKQVKTHRLESNDSIKICDWRITFQETPSPAQRETVVRDILPAKPQRVITSLGPIIGKSAAIQELFSVVDRVSASDATICLTGESGTGKELAARYIHESSHRKAKPFVALNCGAIPENLIESELFGHERGAFTSASAQHKGIFEQADEGTIFLDEIGEMPLDLQTRLLRVLENKKLRRIGGQEDIAVNARVIAATNKDLKNMVRSGKFREDLFFRLYVILIAIAPLRERKEDIPILAEHFLEDLAPNENPKRLSEGASNKLIYYDWPGNVRELKNTIQRAVLISKNNTITKDDIIFSDLAISEPIHLTLEEQDYKSVTDALKAANGNSSEAARRLGISRTTLAGMIERFKLDIKEFKIVK